MISSLVSLPKVSRSEDCGPIHDRDLKLIASLVRKRAQKAEADERVHHFHKLWEKEKLDQKITEAQIREDYHHYINCKRLKEKQELEDRRLRSIVDQQLRKRYIVDSMLEKDQRSADVLATQHGRKATDILDRSVLERVKAEQAAEKRLLLQELEHQQKVEELREVQRRVKAAAKRKKNILGDYSRLTAINNALSEWETQYIRGEVSAMDEAKRAGYAARIAVSDVKSNRMALAKDIHLKRARRLADFTADIREALRGTY